MHMGMVIFNGLAAAFTLIAFILDVYFGAWHWAAIQLVLFLVNAVFAYMHYMTHKKMERRYNERN